MRETGGGGVSMGVRREDDGVGSGSGRGRGEGGRTPPDWIVAAETEGRGAGEGRRVGGGEVGAFFEVGEGFVDGGGVEFLEGEDVVAQFSGLGVLRHG